MSILQYIGVFFQEDTVVFPSAMAKLNTNNEHAKVSPYPL